MGKYEGEGFNISISKEIKIKVDSLIAKNKVLEKYEKSQILLSTIGILGAIVYCFVTSNYSLIEVWKRYEFYGVIILVLIYNNIIEKRVNILKKEVNKEKAKIKDKMILRICD